MIEEIENLKEKLESKFNTILEDESLLSEWQMHPVTKAFQSELVALYLNSIESIADVPTCEATRAKHAAAFGQRQAIEDILNSDYFEEQEDA